MGYWIFMTCMCLLVPGILIAFGSVTRKHPPKEINYLYGYRTARSTKNQNTWEFANKLWGRLSVRWGIIMLVISVVTMLAVIWQSEQIVSTVGTILVTLQLIPVLGIIPVVERALRKNFDKDGNRK